MYKGEINMWNKLLTNAINVLKTNQYIKNGAYYGIQNPT